MPSRKATILACVFGALTVATAIGAVIYDLVAPEPSLYRDEDELGGYRR